MIHLSPKQLFQSDKPRRDRHAELVTKAEFQSTLQCALTQMNIDNSVPPDMATAASFSWRLEGAKQFIRILLNLSEPEITTPRTHPKELIPT